MIAIHQLFELSLPNIQKMFQPNVMLFHLQIILRKLHFHKTHESPIIFHLSFLRKVLSTSFVCSQHLSPLSLPYKVISYPQLIILIYNSFVNKGENADKQTMLYSQTLNDRVTIK